MVDERSDQADEGDAADSTEDSAPEESSTAVRTYRRDYVVVVAAFVAVVVGVLVAVTVFGAGLGTADGDTDGTVAVVTIEGTIAEPIGEDLESELREIRRNDSIDAVVLEMNTPGGSPAPTERIYMSIQRTAEEMPVLASVQGMSASAGYYMMLPSDRIYVLPTSAVGSVGLAASAPQPTPPQRGPSGPDKRGSNVVNDWVQTETIGDIFIETVMEQRGDRLELDREGVSTARVFTGVKSVENGFADEIGSLDDAVADAAERAGLDEYTVAERDVGGTQTIPLLARTEHGIVAIYDENPSLADVEPVRHPMVYGPAVPHIDELEAVASPDLEELLAEAEREGDEDA
ncbi:MAG: S49 family peptidase [Halobacteriota archaeon]